MQNRNENKTHTHINAQTRKHFSFGGIKEKNNERREEEEKTSFDS